MKISLKKMLLLDGIGALLTTILLSQVVARFESVFGMPRDITFMLAGLTLCFALYSLTAYLLVRKSLVAYLKFIAIANLVYCFITFTLIAIYFQSLTGLGIAYFIGEIFIILALVFYEFRVIKSSRINRLL